MDWWKFKKFKLVDGMLILGMLLVIVGIGMNFKNSFWEKSEVSFVSKKITPTVTVVSQSNIKVTIDIAGEVINPGVYQLSAESRINDALVMAGGLGAKADRDWVEKNLNKAERLVDGQKIYIPNQVESIKLKVESKDVLGVSQSKIVRINTAKIEQLDTLSGVGPAIAQRIIDYRTQNGGFKNVEELKLVSGIGDKLFEKIKDEVEL